MRKGGMLLLHVKDPGPDVCVGAGRGADPGPPSTEAVAAEQERAALSPEAKAGPPYCREPGGSLAAVALGLILRRSLASSAVHTVNLHQEIAFTPLPSLLPPPFCFSTAFPSPIPPQFPS